MLAPILSVFLALVASATGATAHKLIPTDSTGQILDPAIFGQLGGWSPFLSQDGIYGISSDLPQGCEVDQVSLMMRHGYRGPSKGVNSGLNELVALLSNASTPYTVLDPSLSFLPTFNQTFVPLTAELLLPWGAQDAFDAGVKFGRRYGKLVGGGKGNWYANFTGVPSVPIRSEDQERMNKTARFFARGLLGEDYESRSTSLIVPDSLPTFNSTLAVGTCTNSANDTSSNDAFSAWGKVYMPAVVDRLNKGLDGLVLDIDTVSRMQNMCSFHTFSTGRISPFCGIFTEDEWKSYSYGQDLQAYNNAGYGGPLGRAWSVGYINEILARLTNSPVVDHTTTNTTLDADPATFPLDKKVYLDFSHDTQLSSALAVLGLLRDSPPLSSTTRAPDSRLWQISRISPMAGRIFYERIQCTSPASFNGTYVRIVVNEGIVPLSGLTGCEGDETEAGGAGLCALDKFVASQSFAQEGGDWENCVGKEWPPKDWTAPV